MTSNKNDLNSFKDDSALTGYAYFGRFFG